MSDEVADSVEQIPARMINEYAYCPRLFYLEHVQGEWAHNADTLDGRFVHRRVDEERGRVPEPEKVVEMPRLHARSVLLGSDALGVTARVDVIEADDDRVIPVDYKRGAPPDVAEGHMSRSACRSACRGLLLREHGYECDEGAIYFAETNQRVRVELTDESCDAHAGVDSGSAPRRRRAGDPSAARAFAEVPALLARRHLPAGRNESTARSHGRSTCHESMTRTRPPACRKQRRSRDA